jgi:hypothetical protein
MSVKLFNTSTLGWFANNFGNSPHNVQVDVHQVLSGVGDVLVAKMLVQAPVDHSESSITIDIDLVSINQYSDQNIGTFNIGTLGHLPFLAGSAKFVSAQLYGINPIAVLIDDIDSSSTQIETDRDLINSGFSSSGTLEIDFDIISYNGIGGTGNNTFLNVTGVINRHDSGQFVLKNGHSYTFALCSGPISSVDAVYIDGKLYSGAYTVNISSDPVTITFPSMPYSQEDKWIENTYDQITPPSSLDYYEIGCTRKSDSDTGYSYFTNPYINYIGLKKVVGCYGIGTNQIPENSTIIDGWMTIDAELWRVAEGQSTVAANPTLYISFNGVDSYTTYSTSQSSTYVHVNYFKSLTSVTHFLPGQNDFYVRVYSETSGVATPDAIFLNIKNIRMFAKYRYQEDGFPKKKYGVYIISFDISTGDSNPAGTIYKIISKQGLSSYIDNVSYQYARDYYDSVSYEFNGLIPGDKSIKDALSESLSQCRGVLIYNNGKIYIKILNHISSIYTSYSSNPSNTRIKSINVNWQDVDSIANKISLTYDKNSIGNLLGVTQLVKIS